MGLASEVERRGRDYGCDVANLGAVGHPDGYCVMRNADGTHYFWVCEDGRESVQCWDRWAVRRSALRDAKKRKGRT